ncbi:MAG: hypothetical protein I8H73_21360 [Pseudomonadales bacterium]|jgi:hypothetical protein|nr:hypothetical protein [Pseudomonadales bacterium]
MSSEKKSTLERSDLLMPAPWTDPAPLDPIVGGEINLLPRSAWSDPSNPLKVKFAPWLPSNPTIDDPETISIFLGTIEIGNKQWTDPIDANDHFVPISADKLVPGESLLTYVMTNWLGTPQQSEPFTITIDKLEPQLNPSSTLIFPSAILPPNKVTDLYLKQNNDEVTADIPGYTAPRPGDRITWYWGKAPGDLMQGGVIVLDDKNYAAPLVLTVPGQLIRDRDDGERYVSYRVQDRAGNQSSYSGYVKLDVAAKPIPRVLPPPKVKEASGNSSSGSLKPLDAINGVTVTIPPEAVIHQGEKVFVQWAEPGFVGEHRTGTPITPGSRDYFIPKDKMAPHMGKAITVYYEVFEPGIDKPHLSNRYSLRVGDLDSTPVVQCDKVSSGNLSLASLTTGFAEFTLESWTFMATEQFIKTTVRGVGADDVFPRDIIALVESPVPEVVQKIKVGRISKVDLQGYKLNNALEVWVSVSFDNKQTWKQFGKLKPKLVA